MVFDLLFNSVRVRGIMMSDLLEMKQTVRVNTGKFDCNIPLVTAYNGPFN